jgi:hypothetical protein
MEFYSRVRVLVAPLPKNANPVRSTFYGIMFLIE